MFLGGNLLHPPPRRNVALLLTPDLDNCFRAVHDSKWEVGSDQQLFHGMTTRRKWRIVILAVVVAVACLFHAPLLRGLAGLLIVDQPTDDYDCVCISSWGHHPSGDRCYDVAADLYRRKPSSRILLVAPDVNRLEEIGAMPSFESMSRRELRARHVPQEAVSVLRGEQWNDWATARALAGWIAITPAIACCCSAIDSIVAQMRRAMDAVLEPDAAASVHLRAVPTAITMTPTGGLAAAGIGHSERAGC